MKRLVILGAGGSGRGVRELVMSVNAHVGERWEFAGFLDDDLSLTDVIGSLEQIRAGLADAYLLSFADPHLRRTWDTDILPSPALIHPSAAVSGGCTDSSGTGLIIRSNSSVAPDASFGRHVYINMNCSIGHDVSMADYVTIHPGANIGGGVVLGRCSTVATGAVVLPRLSIGAGAYVGAGAVVTKDVPAGTTVVGNPARPLESE